MGSPRLVHLKDDLPIRRLDRRQAARPVDHSSHRLNRGMQIVPLPARWKLAVVRGEDIGAQLVLVLEKAPFTFVVIGVAATLQAGDIVDVRQRKTLPTIRLGA